MIDIKVSIASHGKNLSLKIFHQNLDHKNNFHINSDIKKQIIGLCLKI